MEKLFKCSYTGEIFKSEVDCMRHEFLYGKERETFCKTVEEFLDYLKVNNFNVIEAIYDNRILESLDGVYENKFINLKIEDEDGHLLAYHKNSDPVGDGRYETYLDSLDTMISEFQNEFVIPKKKLFEGRLSMFNSHGYYVSGRLNEISLDNILWNLDGKKIRIEVIEEIEED